MAHIKGESVDVNLDGICVAEPFVLRKPTQHEADDKAGGVYSLHAVLDLNLKDFPCKRVFLGYNGTSYGYSGSGGEIFVDTRHTSAVAKHEMIHAWYDSLDADKLGEVLDAYMIHVPNFLHDPVARSRVNGSPVVSYRERMKILREYKDAMFGHQLLDHISSLEEAVAMAPGTVVDHEYDDCDGKRKLMRFVKTNNLYIPETSWDKGYESTVDPEEEILLICPEKEEFLEVHRTADEYFAYQGMYQREKMHPDNRIPAELCAVMAKHGFDDAKLEDVSRKVKGVMIQLDAKTRRTAA